MPLAIDEFFGIRECLVPFPECHVDMGAGAEIQQADFGFAELTDLCIDHLGIKGRGEREDEALGPSMSLYSSSLP